jgi:diguanylate cyclase (GGDEF)-like protein
MSALAVDGGSVGEVGDVELLDDHLPPQAWQVGRDRAVAAMLEGTMEALCADGGRSTDMHASVVLAVTTETGQRFRRWSAGEAAAESVETGWRARDVADALDGADAAGRRVSGGALGGDGRRVVCTRALDESARLTLIGWSEGPRALGPVTRASVAAIAGVGAASVAATLQLRHELHQADRRFQEAHAAAMTDRLTGVGSRRAYEEACHLYRRSGVHVGALAVVVIDLNGLKQLNDTQGHALGDEALRGLGGVLLGAARRADIIARTGGDEFVMLLPKTPAQAAVGMVQRIRVGYAEHTQEKIGLRLTLSAGVAVAPCPELLDQAVAAADAVMYEAKRARSEATPVAELGRADAEVPDRTDLWAEISSIG